MRLSAVQNADYSGAQRNSKWGKEMWRISIFLRSFIVCALALRVSEPIARLPRKRSGRQAKPGANLFPHVLRVAKRGQSLFPGRGITG
jgi:hypothetical protein